MTDVATPSPDARLGVDVGGTFTDLVLAVDDGVRVAKVPSTPDDQATGILHGAAELAVEPSSLARLAHGTTVATNTVLEHDGADVVLVTTRGFADLLLIGRQIVLMRRIPPEDRAVDTPREVDPDHAAKAPV